MRPALFAAAVLCASTLAVHASTLYTYNGATYTQATAPFTTSERVSGNISFASPLAANLNSAVVVPTSFGLYDGVDLYDPSSVNSTGNQFVFSTDANGNVTKYSFFLRLPAPGSVFDSISVSTYTGSTLVVSRASQASTQALGRLDLTSVPPVPTAAVTPEPSSLALLSTGLLGAFGMLKRRLA